MVTRITEETFEEVILYFKKAAEIELQGVTFIDPYGMIGLFEIGEVFKQKTGQKFLYLPGSENVLSYLERMDFFKFAHRYFRFEPVKTEISKRYLRSSYSDVLLEITPIEKSDDIHFIVGKVKLPLIDERLSQLIHNGIWRKSN